METIKTKSNNILIKYNKDDSISYWFVNPQTGKILRPSDAGEWEYVSSFTESTDEKLDAAIENNILKELSFVDSAAALKDFQIEAYKKAYPFMGAYKIFDVPEIKDLSVNKDVLMTYPFSNVNTGACGDSEKSLGVDIVLNDGTVMSLKQSYYFHSNRQGEGTVNTDEVCVLRQLQDLGVEVCNKITYLYYHKYDMSSWGQDTDHETGSSIIYKVDKHINFTDIINEVTKKAIELVKAIEN